MARHGFVPYRYFTGIRSSGGRDGPVGGESQELNVQTSAGRDQTGSAASDLVRRSAPGIARGAVLIAGLTVLSRMFGLIRTLVFSQTVGASCLGTAYVTANQVPNLVYELVLGGALTSAMIPVLARSAERADSDPAERGARKPDFLSAADLANCYPGAVDPGHRGRRHADRRTAQPRQRQCAL